MPPLTEREEDGLDDARSVLWQHRGASQSVHYWALRDAFGWNDDEADRAIHRIFLRHARRHPLAYAWGTLRYTWDMLFATEPIAKLLRDHDGSVPQGPDRWKDLPRAGAPHPLVAAIDALAPTSRVAIIMLALVAPLHARGAARRLALVSIASIAYFLVLAAAVEGALPRFRLPCEPFLAIAAGVEIATLAATIRGHATVLRSSDSSNP
jgi:hypothetical protein